MTKYETDRKRPTSAILPEGWEENLEDKPVIEKKSDLVPAPPYEHSVNQYFARVFREEYERQQAELEANPKEKARRQAKEEHERYLDRAGKVEAYYDRGMKLTNFYKEANVDNVRLLIDDPLTGNKGLYQKTKDFLEINGKYRYPFRLSETARKFKEEADEQADRLLKVAAQRQAEAERAYVEQTLKTNVELQLKIAGPDPSPENLAILDGVIASSWPDPEQAEQQFDTVDYCYKELTANILKTNGPSQAADFVQQYKHRLKPETRASLQADIGRKESEADFDLRTLADMVPDLAKEGFKSFLKSMPATGPLAGLLTLAEKNKYIPPESIADMRNHYDLVMTANDWFEKPEIISLTLPELEAKIQQDFPAAGDDQAEGQSAMADQAESPETETDQAVANGQTEDRKPDRTQNQGELRQMVNDRYWERYSQFNQDPVGYVKDSVDRLMDQIVGPNPVEAGLDEAWVNQVRLAVTQRLIEKNGGRKTILSNENKEKMRQEFYQITDKAAAFDKLVEWGKLYGQEADLAFQEMELSGEQRLAAELGALSNERIRYLASLGYQNLYRQTDVNDSHHRRAVELAYKTVLGDKYDPSVYAEHYRLGEEHLKAECQLAKAVALGAVEKGLNVEQALEALGNQLKARRERILGEASSGKAAADKKPLTTQGLVQDAKLGREIAEEEARAAGINLDAHHRNLENKGGRSLAEQQMYNSAMRDSLSPEQQAQYDQVFTEKPLSGLLMELKEKDSRAYNAWLNIGTEDELKDLMMTETCFNKLTDHYRQKLQAELEAYWLNFNSVRAEAQAAGVDEQYHQHYQSVVMGGHMENRAGFYSDDKKNMADLPLEKQAALEAVGEKYPVSPWLDRLKEEDPEAYRAWQKQKRFGAGSLRELELSEAAFLRLTDLLKREMYKEEDPRGFTDDIVDDLGAAYRSLTRGTFLDDIEERAARKEAEAAGIPFEEHKWYQARRQGRSAAEYNMHQSSVLAGMTTEQRAHYDRVMEEKPVANRVEALREIDPRAYEGFMAEYKGREEELQNLAMTDIRFEEMRNYYRQARIDETIPTYTMANIRRAARTGNWNEVVYAAEIKRAVWEAEARRAEIDPRRHPDYRSVSVGAQVNKAGFYNPAWHKPGSLTAEERARMEKERGKYPVAPRLEELKKTDHDAYKAWQAVFSREKLAEVTMSDGEFEVMTELFRRDLRDIERQQASHSQFVHDVVKAVDPVDLAYIASMAAVGAATGGLGIAGMPLVQYGLIPAIAAKLGLTVGDFKQKLAEERYRSTGLNKPKDRTLNDMLVDIMLGAATANFEPLESFTLSTSQNLLNNAESVRDERTMELLNQGLKKREVTK